jgi:hypothetical protein
MPVLIARVESTSLQPDSTRGDDQGPVVNPRNFFLQAMERAAFLLGRSLFLMSAFDAVDGSSSGAGRHPIRQ